MQNYLVFSWHWPDDDSLLWLQNHPELQDQLAAENAPQTATPTPTASPTPTATPTATPTQRGSQRHHTRGAEAHAACGLLRLAFVPSDGTFADSGSTAC